MSEDGPPSKAGAGAPGGRTLEELHEMERLFAESALAGLFLVQDDVFRYVNPTFARIFGYGREELSDRMGPAELLPPDERPRLEQSRRRLLEGNERYVHYEIQGMTKGGARVDLDVLATAVVFRRRPAVMGMLLDITELKRVEREAVERREEIEALYRASSRLLLIDDVGRLAPEIIAAVKEEFGHALVSLWLLDQERGRLAFSACSEPGMGMPEFLPMNGPGITVSAARTGEILNVADVTREPSFIPRAVPLGSELAIPLKVGDRVLGVLDLESRDKGAFHGRDILILKAFADRAAAALETAQLHGRLRSRTRQLEHFHELALMMVGDPSQIYRAIVRQVLEQLRTPFAGLVRIDGNQILGLATVNPAGFVQGGPRAIEGTPASVVRDSGQPAIIRDVAARFASDEYLTLNAIRTYVGVPVVGRRGEAAGILYAMDVSDRPYGPEDLRVLSVLARRAAEEMEEERREKEKKATERMLMHSEKMASLGQVIAGVAHELNNPLASVLGLAELLIRRDDLPQPARSSLATIASEAERARRVVRNLLAFAREHEPRRTPTSLNDVVKGTLALRESEMRVSNVEVVRDLHDDLPVTLADAHLLQQALLNIVLNAEQAMLTAHGRGRLAVRTRFLDQGSVKPEPTLRVEIEDDGPGIAEQDLGKVFEPFFTTKEVGKGTGLGLSLTHSIVEQHGGTVWVESRRGGGARFVIELPYAPPGAQPRREERAAPEPRVLSGSRILLADDEDALREIAREILEAEGCVVEEAASGRAALAKLESAEFDLVVSDVKMPDIGGLDVYRQACARNPALERRFLFVTGDWVAEETARFLQETGCAHLEKPYNVDQLLQKVGELLARA